MGSIRDVILFLARDPETRLAPPITDNAVFQALEAAYGGALPSDLVECYRTAGAGFLKIDLYDVWHLLGPKEVLAAPGELNVDFVGQRLMPVIDCMDNNFICYNFKDSVYHLFNIVDEMSFDSATEIAGLIEKKIG